MVVKIDQKNIPNIDERGKRHVFELRIIEPAREIANNTFDITFEKPEGFVFIAGQSMKFFPNEVYGSSFSIVTAPEEKCLTFAFRGSASTFKQRILALPQGGLVLVRDVKRLCDTFHYPELSLPVVMIAGGIGITPFISMLRHAVFAGDTRSFTLLYTNQSEKNIAYRSELDVNLSNAIDLKIEYFQTRDSKYSTGSSKRIDASTMKLLCAEPFPIFYVAGPVTMVQDTVSLLSRMNVPENMINFKEFTGYIGLDDVVR